MVKLYKLCFLLAGVMLCACQEDLSSKDSQTPVNAAIQVEVAQVRSSSVEIDIRCRQHHVVSWLVTPPIPADEYTWKTMDAVGKYNLIVEHAQKIDKPHYVFTGLKRRSDYFIGAMGMDASGTIVTAPYMVDFTTTDLTLDLSARYEKREGGGFTFYGNIEAKDPSTSYFHYIFDKEHVDLTNAELVELLSTESVRRGEESVELIEEEDERATYVLAAIPFDESGQAGELVVAYASSEPVVTVDYNGAIRMTQPDKEKAIYEVTFTADKAADFTVTFDGEAYGFQPYSGNGGIGTINPASFTCVYSAWPSYNTSETPVIYQIGRSAGRMAKIAEGGVKFYANITKSVDVFMRVDMSQEDGIPRYWIEQVNDDMSVVLHQTFELFVFSGDYMAPANGTELSTTPDLVDGTEAGVKQAYNLTNAQGANKNEVAFGHTLFDWPTAVKSTLTTEAYIRNRGMEGWTIEGCGERPGALQLSAGSAYGKLTTPALSSLGGATDLLVEIDLARFSSSSTKDIAIQIVGNGSFTSAEIRRDEYTNYSKKHFDKASASCKVSDVVEIGTGKVSGFADATTFLVKTDYCPSTDNNGTVNKPHTHVTLRVSGATAATQIRIDSSIAGNGTDYSATRSFIFDLKITK